MKSEVKLAVGLLGIFASMMMAFWSTGYAVRTETPPLVKLALSQAGCEYVFRSGITADFKNGICMITVRYRAFLFSDGGHIEMPGFRQLEISGGQVVGVVKLDDGRDEPWTAEHKRAVVYLIGTFLLMVVFLWVLSLGAQYGKRKLK